MPLRKMFRPAQIFVEVAREHAERRALVWTATEYTSYERLDRLSNQIAHLLIDCGVRKRHTVCICLEKSPLAYGALIACLKVGAAYFTVDPANPPSRTKLMVDRCRPSAAFVGTDAPRECFDGQTFIVDESWNDAPFLQGLPETAVSLPWDIDGADPAYIMFTSGSTGVPKGATISQTNLVNFIRWTQTQFDIQPDEVFTNVNPLFFDNSVFDIYSSLFAGAALVPFNAATMKDPHAIAARIDELGCTSLFSVPSLLMYLQRLKVIGPDSFPSLRRIVFGGEGYPKPMLAKLYECVGGRTGLYNVYGPTECTCICSVYRISGDDFSELRGYSPLGGLTPSFSHVIIDESGRAVEPGDVGELYLGGSCVGLGYYAAPDQTAAAFVQNPTETRFLDRMYKTGDLVRYDPADRKIHFIGRTDTQIKHQGYRIELGEIEHALATFDGVDEAAAVHTAEDGTSRIVAVVASKDKLQSAALKHALSRVLPRYMVPEKVFVISELPKNANGKVDRPGIVAAIAAGRL